MMKCKFCGRDMILENKEEEGLDIASTFVCDDCDSRAILHERKNLQKIEWKNNSCTCCSGDDILISLPEYEVYVEDGYLTVHSPFNKPYKAGKIYFCPRCGKKIR